MNEYTGDKVLFPMRPGYASNPSAAAVPIEPPLEEYTRGPNPLETLPAPYWNWFIKHLTDNSILTGNAFADLFSNIDYIMTLAGQSYTGQNSDLYSAVKNLWGIDISTETNRATAAEQQLQNSITALESRATTIEGVDDTQDNRLEAIEALIPPQAATTNQLADKDFVNSSITAQASRLLSYDSNGSPFPTQNTLFTAATFYYGPTAVTPTDNDYAIVQEDETQDNGQVRYTFQNGNWIFVYKINDAPFTNAQQAAINSGVTSTNFVRTDQVNQTVAGIKTFTEVTRLPSNSSSVVGPVIGGSTNQPYKNTGDPTLAATEAQITASIEAWMSQGWVKGEIVPYSHWSRTINAVSGDQDIFLENETYLKVVKARYSLYLGPIRNNPGILFRWPQDRGWDQIDGTPEPMPEIQQIRPVWQSSQGTPGQFTQEIAPILCYKQGRKVVVTPQPDPSRTTAWTYFIVINEPDLGLAPGVLREVVLPVAGIWQVVFVPTNQYDEWDDRQGHLIFFDKWSNGGYGLPYLLDVDTETWNIRTISVPYNGPTPMWSLTPFFMVYKNYLFWPGAYGTGDVLTESFTTYNAVTGVLSRRPYPAGTGSSVAATRTPCGCLVSLVAGVTGANTGNFALVEDDVTPISVTGTVGAVGEWGGEEDSGYTAIAGPQGNRKVLLGNRNGNNYSTFVVFSESTKQVSLLTTAGLAAGVWRQFVTIGGIIQENAGRYPLDEGGWSEGATRLIPGNVIIGAAEGGSATTSIFAFDALSGTRIIPTGDTLASANWYIPWGSIHDMLSLRGVSYNNLRAIAGGLVVLRPNGYNSYVPILRVRSTSPIGVSIKNVTLPVAIQWDRYDVVYPDNKQNRCLITGRNSANVLQYFTYSLHGDKISSSFIDPDMRPTGLITYLGQIGSRYLFIGSDSTTNRRPGKFYTLSGQFVPI